DRNEPVFASEGFEQMQLREAAAIRDVGDPFSVGRPAWMKMAMIPERQLVRHAATRRQQVQAVILIRGSACRRVDDARAAPPDAGPRALARQRWKNRLGLENPVRLAGHAAEPAGAERGVAVRDKEDLLAVRRPGRLRAHVPLAEIWTHAAVLVVAGQSDRFTRP